MSQRGLRSAALVPLVIFVVVALAAAAATGSYLLTHKIRVDRAAAGAPAGPPTPGALRSVTAAPPAAAPATPGPEPVPSAVAAALRSPLAEGALGGRVLAQVVDAGTGTVLLDHGGATSAAPASTGKLMTAAAVLSVLSPATRITTKVVSGTSATIVLVGGGDPTLTGASGDEAGAYADAARLSALADRLRAKHVPVSRIVVDDSRFAGPAVSPDWASEDIPTDYAAPITAVMADGGRATPGDTIRSTEPDLAAGRRLAELLGVPGIPVSRGTAAAGAKTLATVRSAPVAELVEQMLQESDNVIAECLARQVALAEHASPSFAGAAAAVRAVLGRLGVPIGAGMRDGSGLAASDRLSPAALAGVLRLVAGAAHPALHAVVAALPVAAWSGTLTDRFLSGGAAAAGAGVVRAKTGTLTGVSSLAGLVHDADGRLLAFALIADRVPAGSAATIAAEAALDRVAAALAGCGCR